MSGGGSEIETLGIGWMKMFIQRNNLLAANNNYMHFYIEVVSIH